MQEETAQQTAERRTHLELIARRGNDRLALQRVAIPVHGRPYELCLGASVLHLRGTKKTHQPTVDANGSVLLFNGEIFAGSILSDVEPNGSDTDALCRRLARCDSDREIADCFASIRGPFAFAYWHAVRRRLWFGRDVLGRRSLCQRQGQRRGGAAFEIASVVSDCADENWIEVPADGLFLFDEDCAADGPVAPVLRYAWHSSVAGDKRLEGATTAQPLVISSPIAPLNRLLPDNDDAVPPIPPAIAITETTISDFIRVLSASVALRARAHNFLCRRCVELTNCGDEDIKCTHAVIGVLFSVSRCRIITSAESATTLSRI